MRVQLRHLIEQLLVGLRDFLQTASNSPKIKVDVIGSKPNASPKGFGRSPTIAFPGAVKTFRLSVVSFSPFVLSIW
jgi:hypothetical protein